MSLIPLAPLNRLSLSLVQDGFSPLAPPALTSSALSKSLLPSGLELSSTSGRDHYRSLQSPRSVMKRNRGDREHSARASGLVTQERPKRKKQEAMSWSSKCKVARVEPSFRPEKEKEEAEIEVKKAKVRSSIYVMARSLSAQEALIASSSPVFGSSSRIIYVLFFASTFDEGFCLIAFLPLFWLDSAEWS